MVMGEFRASGPGPMNWVRDQNGEVIETIDESEPAPGPPVPPVPPVPPGLLPPAQVFRCEAAGFRAARLLCAAFRELSVTFTPQVAAQLALDLTKTVLSSPSGAKILEE